VATSPRVAVLLPVPWRGGMLRAGRQICRLLLEALGGEATVILGVAAGKYDLEHALAGFATDRLRVAEVTWVVDRDGDGGYPIARPQAAGIDFATCDFWVIAHAGLEGVIDPRVPYAVYAPDFIPRYVPEIYGAAGARDAIWTHVLRQFRIMRDARCVLVTTPQTAADAVVYAGVRRERVLAAPLFFENPAAPRATAVRPTSPFILWVTNSTPHKNHLAALDALSIYYSELGGALDVRLCGPETQRLDPERPRTGTVHPYWVDVALRIASSAALRRRVQLLGEASAQDYVDLLHGAAFLWHPTRYDNGTFAAIDAGRFGRAIVSGDYPQMRHMSDYFGLAVDFADSLDARAMAERLREAEGRYRSGALAGTFRVPPDHDARVRHAFAEIVARVAAGQRVG
jgi:hypothetical protein